MTIPQQLFDLLNSQSAALGILTLSVIILITRVRLLNSRAISGPDWLERELRRVHRWAMLRLFSEATILCAAALFLFIVLVAIDQGIQSGRDVALLQVQQAIVHPWGILTKEPELGRYSILISTAATVVLIVICSVLTPPFTRRHHWLKSLPWFSRIRRGQFDDRPFLIDTVNALARSTNLAAINEAVKLKKQVALKEFWARYLLLSINTAHQDLPDEAANFQQLKRLRHQIHMKLDKNATLLQRRIVRAEFGAANVTMIVAFCSFVAALYLCLVSASLIRQF